jgi:hypothetical protein
MTQKDTLPISRRRLLAGAGAAGVGAFTGGAGLARQFTSAPPPYTHYTYAAADEDGPQLRVAWYSTYNGTVTKAEPADGTAWTAGESPDAAYVESYESEVYGPLVSEGNVLPGDSGGISVGLIPEEMDARIRLVATGADPETDISGRLSEVVDVTLWYDTGIFGIGGCTGATEPPGEGAITLPLAEFGRRYGPDTGEPLMLRDCLPAGERLCIGFAWRIDEAVANEYADESVGFGLSFRAEQCGGMLR